MTALCERARDRSAQEPGFSLGGPANGTLRNESLAVVTSRTTIDSHFSICKVLNTEDYKDIRESNNNM